VNHTLFTQALLAHIESLQPTSDELMNFYAALRPLAKRAKRRARSGWYVEYISAEELVPGATYYITTAGKYGKKGFYTYTGPWERDQHQFENNAVSERIFLKGMRCCRSWWAQEKPSKRTLR
jgi:hypothetical protein